MLIDHCSWSKTSFLQFFYSFFFLFSRSEFYITVFFASKCSFMSLQCSIFICLPFESETVTVHFFLFCKICLNVRSLSLFLPHFMIKCFMVSINSLNFTNRLNVYFCSSLLRFPLLILLWIILLKQIQILPNIHGWLSANLNVICRMFCTQEDPIDWSCEKHWGKRTMWVIEWFQIVNIGKVWIFTMCERMEDALSIDHHDEFGTFERHSYLRVRQNLAMVPLMYLSQIARIWHDQLDRNYEVHARTIESMNLERIEMLWILLLQFIHFQFIIQFWMLPELNLLDICDTQYWL